MADEVPEISPIDLPPATRRGLCVGCDAALDQAERTPGIWRPLLCSHCIAEQAAVSPFLAALPITQRMVAAMQFALASVGYRVPPPAITGALRAACAAEVNALGPPLPADTTYQAPGEVPVHCSWCKRPGRAAIVVLRVQGGADVRVYDIEETFIGAGDVAAKCPHCGRWKWARVLRESA